MTEPDRGPRMCPQCRVGLRTLPTNLVCDACHGMFFTKQELEATLFESGAMELSLSDRQPSSLACPHCQREMVSCLAHCAVANGRAFGPKSIALADRLCHCEPHGVWLGASALQHALATVGRTSNRWLRFGDHRFDDDG